MAAYGGDPMVAVSWVGLLATTATRPAAKQERIQGLRKRCGIVERAEQPERRATGRAGQCRGRSYATSLDHAVRGHDSAKHDRQIRNQPEDADLEKDAKVLVVEDPVDTRVIGIQSSEAAPENEIVEDVRCDRGVISAASIGVVSPRLKSG